MSETHARTFEQERAAAVSLAEALGIPVREELEDGRVFELMRFVNGMPRYYTTHNAGGAQLIRSDRVYPGGGSGFHLTGAGQTLAIWDAGGVQTTHDEFVSTGASRVTQRDNASGTDWHATHVAGTMVAAGKDPAARGMSWEAMLDAYDWSDDQGEMAAAAAAGLQVSQHSYGLITGWYWDGDDWYWYGDIAVDDAEDYRWGFYSSQARNWDEIACHAPHYLIVKSAGNDRGRGPDPGTEHFYWEPAVGWQTSTITRDFDGGDDGYGTVSHASVSKNLITVGAVRANQTMSSFSGWGPTDDGRIKPDVVAKGVSVLSAHDDSDDAYATASGTSMSGPMVSGSVGLLLEHQKNLHPGNTLAAASLKALILHSADDMIGGNPGPDYHFGWGLMNTERAIEIMQANKDNDGIHIYEATLNDGDEFTLSLHASGQEPLRATIVWTDAPGSSPAPALNPPDLMLVNDLDMRISNASGNTFKPYVLNPANPGSPASTGDNFRDNVEMVHVESPGANEAYEITISHKGSLVGGSQGFSLIVTGNGSVPETETWVVSLSASPAAGGSVSGGGNYAFEDVVTVDASPATGYDFVTWSGDIHHLDDPVEPSATFVMPDQDVALVAEFVINTYTLSYMAGDHGSIEGETQQTVEHSSDGSPVEAIPNQGYHFTQWSDGVTDNPRTDTGVTASLEVTAQFAINTYTLSYLAGDNGSLEGDTHQTVEHGNDGSPVEAIPDQGYHFTQWSDGVTDNPRTDTGVTDSLEVTAQFAINTYTLSYLAGDNGSLEGDTQQTVDHGSDGSPVEAIPDQGYHFTQWSDGVTDNPRTDTGVTADLTVTAQFAINTYEITATASPAAGGSVSGTGGFDHGETVTLEATPATGYEFLRWTEDGSEVSTDNPYIFTANQNRQLVAEFTLETYEVTLSASPAEGGDVTGAGNYAVGVNVAIEAIPATGYHFDTWSGDIQQLEDPGEESATFVMPDQDVALVAEFVINTYTLSYLAGDHGSIEGETQQTVEHGSDGSPVEAIPNQGYHFTQWSDGVTDNPRTDAGVTANLEVTAAFAINTYTLSYLAGDHGSIEGETQQTVEHGSDGSPVEAIPDQGYHFTQWSDGVTDNPRTDTGVTASLEVTAQFAINTYTLSYLAGNNGSLEGDTHQTVEHGRDGSPVEAIPDEGYHFTQWSDGVTDNPRTDTGVTASLEVTAQFAINTYEVNAEPNDEAFGSVTGGGTFAHFEEVTLEATPAAGYEFIRWTEDGSEVSTENPYVFTATENRHLIAGFALKTYKVIFIVISEVGEVIPGAVITLGDTENEAGTYVFEEVPPGAYDFSVLATGYFDVTGMVDVTDSDLQKDVVMEIDDTSISPAELPKPTFYPNPADDIVYIDLKHQANLPVSISLINVYGQTVRSIDLQDSFSDELVLYVEDLLPGIYLLNIRVGDMQHTGRILLR